MPFDGSEGSAIELDVAAQWTKNYRDQNPDQTLGHFFGRDILEQILGQAGCQGIRLYYALDQQGTRQLLAVGADSAEDDQLDDACIVADNSKGSPPNMGVLNPLNGDMLVNEPE